MKKISLKAIITGAIVNVLLGYLFLLVPIIYVLLPLQMRDDINFEQLGTVFLNAVEGSARLPSLQALAQLASAFFAGYITARIARKHEAINGCLAALPCGALSAYRLVTRPDGLVANIDFMLIVIALACAAAGGCLAIIRNRAARRKR